MPRVVDATPEALAAGHGYVTTDLGAGALMLVDEDEQHLRLSWESDAADSDGRRALPAGRYSLTGYRVLATDEDGAAWHLSATKPRLREIEVVAGKTIEVEIDRRVHLVQTLTRSRANVGVQGDGHAGLSIFKDGKRIALAYRVLDARDHELVAGELRYG